jgi:hypothetical protein
MPTHASHLTAHTLYLSLSSAPGYGPGSSAFYCSLQRSPTTVASSQACYNIIILCVGKTTRYSADDDVGHVALIHIAGDVQLNSSNKVQTCEIDHQQEISSLQKTRVSSIVRILTMGFNRTTFKAGYTRCNRFANPLAITGWKTVHTSIHCAGILYGTCHQCGIRVM